MLSLFFFFTGLIIGSFLNVIISRIPRDESIVSPNSYCPKCRESLKPWDLIPVISYVILKGRCRYCEQRISLRYPLVEILTGLLFVFSWTQAGDIGITLFIYWVLFSSLVISVFTDIENMIIPNRVTYPALLTLLIMNALNNNIISSIAGIAVCFGLLFLAGIISKGNMGGGDIKLAAVIGAALGPFLGLLSLVLASFIGSIVGITLILSGIRGRKDPLVFAPFMFAGVFFALLFNEQLSSLFIGLRL